MSCSGTRAQRREPTPTPPRRAPPLSPPHPTMQARAQSKRLERAQKSLERYSALAETFSNALQHNHACVPRMRKRKADKTTTPRSHKHSVKCRANEVRVTPKTLERRLKSYEQKVQGCHALLQMATALTTTGRPRGQATGSAVDLTVDDADMPPRCCGAHHQERSRGALST